MVKPKGSQSNLQKDITLKQVKEKFEKLKKKGKQPFLKGKGGGTVKIMFE